MIRRMFTLVFCAVAFWAGMKLMQFRYAEACREAGGVMRTEDLCAGAQP